MWRGCRIKMASDTTARDFMLSGAGGSGGGGYRLGIDMGYNSSNYYSSSSLQMHPRYEIVCGHCERHRSVYEGESVSMCDRCGAHQWHREPDWRMRKESERIARMNTNDVACQADACAPKAEPKKAEVKKSINVNPIGLLILGGIGFAGYKILSREINKK